MEEIQIFEIFEWKPRVTAALDPISIPEFKHTIEFRDVSFAYPDQPDRPILRNLSFIKGELILTNLISLKNG